VRPCHNSKQYPKKKKKKQKTRKKPAGRKRKAAGQGKEDSSKGTQGNAGFPHLKKSRSVKKRKTRCRMSRESERKKPVQTRKETTKTK